MSVWELRRRIMMLNTNLKLAKFLHKTCPVVSNMRALHVALYISFLSSCDTTCMLLFWLNDNPLVCFHLRFFINSTSVFHFIIFKFYILKNRTEKSTLHMFSGKARNVPISNLKKYWEWRRFSVCIIIVLQYYQMLYE